MENSESALYELVGLNAISLHSPSALYVNMASANLSDIRTLIDSGSTSSFLDSRFAQRNNLKIKDLKTPLRLTPFNGTTTLSGLITQSTQQTIRFPCGICHEIMFLLTCLDRSASAILGYSWLRQHNLLINWVTHKLTFE